MTAKRKGLISLLAVALVLVISAGLTLAYLTGDAGEATNIFTFADNIRGELDEPNWDPEDGENLTPGMEIRKDPMITNTSDNGVNEYASIMVTFKPGEEAEYDGEVLTDEDTARLLGLIDIDWNDDRWTLVGAYGDDGTWTPVDATQSNLAAVQNMNNQVWVYNDELAPGEITDPLYNTITIKGDIEDEDMTWLSGVALNHTPDCWEYNKPHDGLLCEITYKHHENCAVYGDSDAGSVAKGGMSADGHTCDCTPVEQHQEGCPSLEGTLKDPGCHTVTGSICGFQITNSGAIVQADQFTSATDSLTVDAFATLFDPN